jgi:hypothetical protein
MNDRPHPSGVSVNEQVNVDVATMNCIINSESCNEQTAPRDLSLVFVKECTTMALLPALTILMPPTHTHRNGFRDFATLTH